MYFVMCFLCVVPKRIQMCQKNIKKGVKEKCVLKICGKSGIVYKRKRLGHFSTKASVLFKLSVHTDKGLIFSSSFRSCDKICLGLDIIIITPSAKAATLCSLLPIMRPWKIDVLYEWKKEWFEDQMK